MVAGNPPSSEVEQARRLLNLGADLLERGRAAEAVVHLQAAYEIDTEYVPTLINLGGAYVMLGQHERAIPLLEMARDAEPSNAMIWINLGAAYLGNPVLATPERQQRAIVAFQQALELNPAAPNVHYNLGLIFVDRGDGDLATAAFRRALQVNPLDRDAANWLRKLDASKQEETGSE
jgi:tetratricopeptide (TPR) repeat protein